jgi:hypothetical protein
MVSTVPDLVPASVANARTRNSGVAPPSPAIDCEAFMNHRSPLRHLLHTLLPSKGTPSTPADTDFVDTQPVDARAAAAQASRRRAALPRRGMWAESALDLETGSEIMEMPDDAAADLMDEFFAKAAKKAA